MKDTLKKHWKPITAVVCCAVVLCTAAYYVNFIYIPEARQARARELDAAALAQRAQQAQSNPEDYHFSINTSLKPDNDAAPSGADESTTGADANIGSGDLEDITGADGVYHGETPAAASSGKPAGTAPSGGADTGLSTGKPSGDATTPSASGTDKPSGSNPSGSTTAPSDANQGGNTTRPSDGDRGGDNSTPSGGGSGTETKPNTPSTPPVGSSTTDKPSGGSNSGSSTPKDGDIRTENGKQQEYVDGFGWVDIGSGKDDNGGFPDYIEMGPDTGNYIGEMG